MPDAVHHQVEREGKGCMFSAFNYLAINYDLGRRYRNLMVEEFVPRAPCRNQIAHSTLDVPWVAQHSHISYHHSVQKGRNSHLVISQIYLNVVARTC